MAVDLFTLACRPPGCSNIVVSSSIMLFPLITVFTWSSCDFSLDYSVLLTWRKLRILLFSMRRRVGPGEVGRGVMGCGFLLFVIIRVLWLVGVSREWLFFIFIMLCTIYFWRYLRGGV